MTPPIARTYVRAGDPELLNRYKAVAVVRRDVEMSKGKLAAQVAHGFTALAVEGVGRSLTFRDWYENGMRKVVLRCADGAELLDLALKAEAAGLPCVLVEDAGLTEVEAGTLTCLCLGPGTQDELNAITGHLKVL